MEVVSPQVLFLKCILKAKGISPEHRIAKRIIAEIEKLIDETIL